MQEKFQVQLYGHRHEASGITESSIVGTSILLQGGCLYQSREYANGYQLIDLALDRAHLRLQPRRYYDHPRRAFGPDGSLGETPFLDLPLRLTTSSREDRWKRLLPLIEDYILEKGSEHLSLMSVLDPLVKYDLNSHIVQRPLKAVAYAEVSEPEAVGGVRQLRQRE